MFRSLLCWIACLTVVATAFTVPTLTTKTNRRSLNARSRPASWARYMAEGESTQEGGVPALETVDPMEEAMEAMDEETRRLMEKSRRADELRAQEVFMKKSTGKHKCTNCEWEYDEEKGDSMMIGGTIKPGTAFAELPSNWRCPVCRASKDSFTEVVEEIPGFEVNQGYGFGTNSWTAGQKNLAVFGGLGFFFLLFLSGYAMN